jgi:ubiquinone/menaquinone biosynthesis C-methylase UbiE
MSINVKKPTAEAVKKYYEKGAFFYDSNFERQGYAAPDAVDFILSETFYAAQKPPRILDIGIGTGLLSEKFRARYPDAEIIGVDLTPSMLAMCRRKGIANELIESDIQKDGLPFEGEAFDIVISSGVFEILEDQAGVIAEIGRVLKPGGAFSFTTVDAEKSIQFSSDTVLSAQDMAAAFNVAGLHLNDSPSAKAYRFKGEDYHYRVNTGTKPEKPFVIPS